MKCLINFSQLEWCWKSCILFFPVLACFGFKIMNVLPYGKLTTKEPHVGRQLLSFIYYVFALNKSNIFSNEITRRKILRGILLSIQLGLLLFIFIGIHAFCKSFFSCIHQFCRSYFNWMKLNFCVKNRNWRSQ